MNETNGVRQKETEEWVEDVRAIPEAPSAPIDGRAKRAIMHNLRMESAISSALQDMPSRVAEACKARNNCPPPTTDEASKSKGRIKLPFGIEAEPRDALRILAFLAIMYMFFRLLGIPVPLPVVSSAPIPSGHEASPVAALTTPDSGIGNKVTQ